MPRLQPGVDDSGRRREARDGPVGNRRVLDPFLTELDWSSLESPAPSLPETPRPSSGVIKIDAAHADAASAEAPRPEDGSRQYRVLAQKDQGFAGKFNATKLEETLNDHARRGWSLKAAVTINMPSHAGNHDELVVILER